MRGRQRPISCMLKRYMFHAYIRLRPVSEPCMPEGEVEPDGKGACFIFRACAETGCDDRSDTTDDQCVNQGTKNEGCLYTVKTGNVSRACSKDSDCVPEQCCHPTACMNKGERRHAT